MKTILKKYKCKPEMVVQIKTKQELFEGVLLPTISKKVITLKIKSGYNIGIDIKEIISMKSLNEIRKVGKPKAKELRKNPDLPTICILQTGGTISSRVDYRTGVVKASFKPEDLITMYPELEKIANFHSRMLGQMYSEDLRFSHYELIAKAIEEEIKKGIYKGIILAHGTDTLTYTSAALSFMLKNCPIPVILVGSQRSTDRGSSDAALNLLSAVEFISRTDFSGVGICMHEASDDRYCDIFPPTKTKKLHTSRRDAFKAVNDSPIARIDYWSKKIIFLKKDYPRFDKTKKFSIKRKMEQKVAIVKCHPNMFPEQFEIYYKKKFKGLVIEGTGLGQAPIGVPDKESKINGKNFLAIKKLLASGCVVIMTSQCVFGEVQMHVYNNALQLQKIGVLCGKDMLCETAFIKLAWLLGNFSKKQVKELVGKNLRGEINERMPMKRCTFNWFCSCSGTIAH